MAGSPREEHRAGLQPMVVWDLLSRAVLEKQDKSLTGQQGDWLHAPHMPLARGDRGPGVCVLVHSVEGWGVGLTLRYSTGLVTLNLSIVVMMMAGVVRKKSKMKRTTLMTRQRSHQMKPRMERCSLGGRRRHPGAGRLTRPQRHLGPPSPPVPHWDPYWPHGTTPAPSPSAHQ